MSSPYDTNRNARIQTRTLRNGNLRTETARRDSGIKASVTTSKSGGRVGFSMTTEEGLVVRLNGRQARTLFRVLARHYDASDRSFEPIINW
jgi:hypothetical protein